MPDDDPRLYIRTFGCQMNQHDSARIVELFAAEGIRTTADPERADLVIVNTCSVRAKPERKVQAFLERFAAGRRRGRPRMLVVAGCVAQQHGAELLSRHDTLDLVVGPDQIAQLPALVRAVEEGTGERRAAVAFDPPGDGRFLHADPALRRPGLRELVTIGKGCDNHCAYCIVPAVRGPERSRPAADIVAEVADLVAAGVREITLLGQNVNSYGPPEGPRFPALLDAVAAVPDLWRLRFTTSHPRDFDEALARRFADLPVLCDWLHLPFQAGADGVLARMNRGYTAADYRRRVELYRRFAPTGALGADCIVGFPGETEADFRATLALVEEVRFDQLFSFQYSPRPGTVAAGLPDDVPAEAKAERLAELQARQAAITAAKNRALVGRTVEVLVEGVSARGDQLSGRTTDNRIVNFPGEAACIGTRVRVTVEEGLANSLRGRLARSAA